MEDERHFNFYDPQKRIPNQIALLSELEAQGYEIRKKRILTTDKIGVPVTAILLIMKESLDLIKSEQAQISLVGKYKSRTISEKDLMTRTGIVPGKTYTILTNQDWSEYEYYSPASQSASGSATYEIYTGYEPKAQSYPPLLDRFTSPNKNVIITNNEIIRTDQALKRKHLYQVYKSIISFLEFSYALSERVRFEIKSFETLTSKQISSINIPSEFNKNCNRRGQVVHNGEFHLEVEPNNSRIIFAQKVDVEKSFEQTYDECVDWINQVYGQMLSK